MACATFAVLSFRGKGDDIAHALTDVEPLGLVVAYVATIVGLLTQVTLWRNVVADFGLRIPVAPATSLYFTGQLGKYIPGSVWSIGVQAHLASAFKAKPRVTAGAGLVALGYCVATGALVGTALCAAGVADAPWPRWISAVTAVGAAISLAPPIINKAGSIAAGSPLRMTWSRSVTNVALCAVLWSAWSAGVAAPFGEYHNVLVVAAAFGLSYALGVVIILAPAGLGPREALFITLLAPVVSLPTAAAMAVVSRLTHAAADVSVAAASWAWARRTQATEDHSTESV
jgi:hypothetical protein